MQSSSGDIGDVPALVSAGCRVFGSEEVSNTCSIFQPASSARFKSLPIQTVLNVCAVCCHHQQTETARNVHVYLLADATGSNPSAPTSASSGTLLARTLPSDTQSNRDSRSPTPFGCHTKFTSALNGACVETLRHLYNACHSAQHSVYIAYCCCSPWQLVVLLRITLVVRKAPWAVRLRKLATGDMAVSASSV